ncbi:MAG TPA: succinate dehydrogenase, cytochrome b556 subunit [Parvularculaceae bacterium]|nr:succinate dehydrogenase, cytochrome b556 subunit [Parvularculaceae bacterium]HNS87108.1 succinate dehydrogenase, cytochrome b556 subunit [Parvularculaceae bacterium]
MASDRPLSPHLQIWRWTPTMAASITHRATGVALYAGTILLSLWVFALAQGESAYAALAGFLGSPIGVFILFGYAWALLFHTLNGLRHLYWDMGRGLEVDQARLSAWLVFAASLILAILIVAGGLSAG